MSPWSWKETKMNTIRSIGLLVGSLCAATAFGQNLTAPTPGTARVVSVRTMTTYSESASSYTDTNGKVQTSGSGATDIRQVYKLETDKAFIEVTGYENIFKAHGRPALQIGDVVQYEVDQKHGQYVKILLTDPKKGKSKWHDFLRVSAEAKPLQAANN
jgi:hypothetical protein